MSYEPGISKIKKSKTGGVKDYARAILGQGLGLGFGDEAEAYVRSILSGKEYDEVIKEVRSEIEEFREEQPVAAYGSELAGGLLTGVAGLGRTALAQAVKKAPKTTLMPILPPLYHKGLCTGAPQRSYICPHSFLLLVFRQEPAHPAEPLALLH